METKTVTLELDAYNMLAKKRRGGETLSQVVRRLVPECPALTTDELLEAIKPFWGKGAGKRIAPRKSRRHAAA